MDLEIDTPYQRVRITDNAGVRLMKFQRNRQSSMLVDDPFETDFEYPVYLHSALAVSPQASRALVIGLGGGSVVKRMWRDYPWMRVDAVEIDPVVVELAYEHFALPDDPRLRVSIADGREFVRTSADTYDIVVVDAFDDDRVPFPFLTEDFMRDVRDHLSDAGVIAFNFIGAIYGEHSKPFRALYRTAANTWAHHWVFALGLSNDATDKTRNLVLLASDTPVARDDLLERIRTRVDGIVTVPGFEAIADDLFAGPIRTGDVGILTENPGRRAQRRKRRY